MRRESISRGIAGRGSLFTSGFLTETIKTLAEWKALDADAHRHWLKCLLSDVPARGLCVHRRGYAHLPSKIPGRGQGA